MAKTAIIVPFRPCEPAPATAPDERTFFAQQMTQDFPDDPPLKEGEYIGGHDHAWKQK